MKLEATIGSSWPVVTKSASGMMIEIGRGLTDGINFELELKCPKTSTKFRAFMQRCRDPGIVSKKPTFEISCWDNARANGCIGVAWESYDFPGFYLRIDRLQGIPLLKCYLRPPRRRPRLDGSTVLGVGFGS